MEALVIWISSPLMTMLATESMTVLPPNQNSRMRTSVNQAGIPSFTRSSSFIFSNKCNL